jgi:branched-chain amino acid transport system ATP-binding protein
MPSPLLQVDDFHASYGPVEVLHGISLEVHSGEIVALIGANGAGKTSTLAALSGLLPATQGTLAFDGADLGALPVHARVRRGLVQVPEGRRIFPRLTVLENLVLGAYALPDPPAEADLARAFALFPVLRERRHQKGGTLSGGEQQMLAIARALLGRPRCLLLDEPSLGLAPRVVLAIFDTIRRIRTEGTTVLLVEQNARAALELADRAYVMETGRILFSGTGRELLDNPLVQKAYLGT